MKKLLLCILVLLLSVLLFGCAGTSSEPSENEQDRSDDVLQQEDDNDIKAVRNIVESFGLRLQIVSLQASKDILEKSMQENYGDFVSQALLEKWISDPLNAPGRLTSSPWPDRIEILTIENTADNEYKVDGEIIEITSTEKESGEAAAKRPIAIVVKKMNDRWIIDDVVLEDYNKANDGNIGYGSNLFGLYIPDSGRCIYLDVYPVDFPFGCNVIEKERKTYRAESFGQVTVVESDGLQVTYLSPGEGVYTVISLRADKKNYAAAGIRIGDTEKLLLEQWPDKFKKLDSISYDDEAWFDEYDVAYAYTPEESTKSIVFLIKNSMVSGIELINGLDGSIY